MKKSKDINALPNFLAFESQESQNILSHSILLKDLKDVYMKELSSGNNWIYIRKYGLHPCIWKKECLHILCQ